MQLCTEILRKYRGHPPSADLRYGEENCISPSPHHFCCHKGITQDIYSLYSPDVPKKLALIRS